MKSPSFSVLLPTNKLDKLFIDALNSVSLDLAEDAEVLIVLNGEAIPQASEFDWARFGIPNLRLLTSHERGLVAALNIGLGEARGEFIARMDADDLTLTGRFSEQLAFLRNNRTFSAVGTQYVEVCEHGTLGRKSNLPHRLRSKPWRPLTTRMAHPTVMFRKEAVQMVGGYRADFLHVEDQDLWLRLLDVSRVGNLSRVFLKYRKHANQVSVENTGQQRQGLIRTYLWNSRLGAPRDLLLEANAPQDYKNLIRNSECLSWRTKMALRVAVDLWSFTNEVGSGVGSFLSHAVAHPAAAVIFIWSNRRWLRNAFHNSVQCQECRA